MSFASTRRREPVHHSGAKREGHSGGGGERLTPHGWAPTTAHATSGGGSPREAAAAGRAQHGPRGGSSGRSGGRGGGSSSSGSGYSHRRGHSDHDRPREHTGTTAGAGTGSDASTSNKRPTTVTSVQVGNTHSYIVGCGCGPAHMMPHVTPENPGYYNLAGRKKHTVNEWTLIVRGDGRAMAAIDKVEVEFPEKVQSFLGSSGQVLPLSSRTRSARGDVVVEGAMMNSWWPFTTTFRLHLHDGRVVSVDHMLDFVKPSDDKFTTVTL